MESSAIEPATMPTIATDDRALPPDPPPPGGAGGEIDHDKRIELSVGEGRPSPSPEKYRILVALSCANETLAPWLLPSHADWILVFAGKPYTCRVTTQNVRHLHRAGKQ